MSAIRKNYQTIAAEKKLQRQNKIPKEWIISDSYHGASNLMDVPITCGILSDVECEITSGHDATSLLEKLKNGLWSAEQVTVAFCKRAAIAHQLVRVIIHCILLMT
jgi:amidase